MKLNRHARIPLIVGCILFIFFILFTVLLENIDVSVVPPGVEVGFSTFNGAVLGAIGASELAYTLSEILGILILTVPFIFGVIALIQWIKRKSFCGIDRDLWILFAAYAVTIAFYCFFEVFVINCRPILVDGELEASYPSSHTLLAIVILGTAMEQFRRRIPIIPLRIVSEVFLELALIATAVLRLLAGVHWATDIIGALLLGSSLIFLYHSFILMIQKKS